MARLLVIDDDTSLLRMIRLMLERQGHEVITAEGPQEGLTAVSEHRPDLVILDVMMPGMSGYAVARTLRKDPQTAALPILILTARAQPADQKMAMESGANGYLSKPITVGTLTAQIEEILAAAKTTKAAPPRQTPERPIGVFESAEQAGRPSAPLNLPVTTVISLRGGSGATTIAVNLAMLLCCRQQNRTCLVDLSMTGGHVGLQLHMVARQTWGDLLDNGDVPDAKLVGSIVVPHPATGLSVLAAPPIPSMRALSQNAFVHTLSVLSGGFQEIVVDVDSLTPASIGALLAAHTVFVVAGDDVTGVHTARHTLQTLKNLGIDMDRVRIALNRARPDTSLPLNVIMKALNHPIAAEIPYDPDQVQAVRHGTPLVLATPESDFARAVQQLLETVY